jgi:tetratricopeptide (TPR) repeat protein
MSTTPTHEEIQAAFRADLRQVPAAQRAAALATALVEMGPWVERAEIIVAGAGLLRDPALGSEPSANETLGLLALGRAMLALRRFDLADEILRGLAEDTRGRTTVETWRAALAMRTALHLGRVASVLAWDATTALPTPDDARPPAILAETALTLGLARLVRGDLAAALTAFDVALDFAATAGDGEAMQWLAWSSLAGQANVAFRAGDLTTAARLGDTAVQAAAADFERSLSIVVRAAAEVLGGQTPAPDAIDGVASILNRRATPGMPVDLCHGLPVEPASDAGASPEILGFAYSLADAVADRVRALDATGVALCACGAAWLHGLAERREEARLAIIEGLAALRGAGPGAAMWLDALRRAAVVLRVDA